MSDEDRPGEQDDGAEPAPAAVADAPPTPLGAPSPPSSAEQPSSASEDPSSPAPAAPARIEYDEATLGRYVEAMLFVAQRPLTVPQVARSLRTTFAAVRRAFRALQETYAERGIRVVEVGGAYQFRTAAECADAVRRLLDVKPLRLSKAALESLAVIAYRQPVTKPDIDEIRGVDSGSALKLLLDRNLVRVLGRKEEPGRPLLYGTTQAFLEFFGLASLNDLPSLKEYTELTEEGRRQLERDLFARSPEPVEPLLAERDGPLVPPRRWEDLVEVLGDDLGELPEGVEVEPEGAGEGGGQREHADDGVGGGGSEEKEEDEVGEGGEER